MRSVSIHNTALSLGADGFYAEIKMSQLSRRSNVRFDPPSGIRRQFSGGWRGGPAQPPPPCGAARENDGPVIRVVDLQGLIRAPGTFRQAYNRNSQVASETVLENS